MTHMSSFEVQNCCCQPFKQDASHFQAPYPPRALISRSPWCLQKLIIGTQSIDHGIGSTHTRPQPKLFHSAPLCDAAT